MQFERVPGVRRGEREIVGGSEQQRPIRLDTPGNGLSRDRAEGSGRKLLWVLGVLLRDPYHLTDADDDLGKRCATLLLRRHSRLHRKPKRTDESEKPLVLFGDGIFGLPGNRNRFFHGAPWR